MPAVTRGAALLLNQAFQAMPEGDHTNVSVSSVLGLRQSVSAMSERVWSNRNNIDAYTLASMEEVQTQKPQVDHVLEVQLAEHAFMQAVVDRCGGGGGGVSMAQQQSAQTLRDAFNDIPNLNVTSTKVNQSKRGPLTAALNRLRAGEVRGTLRHIPLEQLARQGRAKWLVDNGVWARIESEIVKSYDVCSDVTLSNDAMPSSVGLTTATIDSLSHLLQALEIEGM
jgi:hypothetical protein